MVATEVVFLQSSAETITPEFRSVLSEAQAIQDAWVEEKFPGQTTAVAKWQEIERPNHLLITQTWPDTSQQRVWGASEEGRSGHVKIMAHIAFEDQRPKAEKFHVEGDIFNVLQEPDQIQLLDSPVISVGRHIVSLENKEAFMAKFNEVKWVLEGHAKPYVVKGGWRMEKDDETKEEWLLFIGWPNIEAHKDFAQSPNFSKYRQISELVTGFDVWHYQRIQ